MSTRHAAIALRRFGLGARSGEMKRIAADPRGFVLQALAHADGARISEPALEPSHVTFTTAMEAQRKLKLARAAAKDGPVMPDASPTKGDASDPANQEGPPASMDAPPGAKGSAPQGAPTGSPAVKPGQVRREAFLSEAFARIQHAAATDAAFLERLVMFWSNHFCVSANKGPVRGIAGGYEREAIRPNVLGRFADMLLSVVQHPAMLVYLDNAQSIGPNSRAGINRGRGLNENLAREILELHTLGADGGYTQEDVTNLARILTGWTVGTLDTPAAEPGRFFFAPRRHEPGDWTVLGKRYRDEGQLTGQAVLRDLAQHPATARHIARKLARHFVADDPPAAVVERLEATFMRTDGDLAAVAKALVETPQAWEAPPAKVLPPYDFLVSLARGLALEPKPQDVLRLGSLLGQPLWRPPSPMGWPDTDNAWAGPSALSERLRIAEVAARQADRSADPRAVASDILGDAMVTPTRQAIARAETREQGLELMLMSPEFQRR